MTKTTLMVCRCQESKHWPAVTYFEFLLLAVPSSDEASVSESVLLLADMKEYSPHHIFSFLQRNPARYIVNK